MHAEYTLRGPSVTELVTAELLKKLATPEDYKAGLQIVKKDGVELQGVSPLEVMARVGEMDLNDTGHTILTDTQQVTLRAPDGEVTWQCTCGNDQFCKHAVAAAVALRRQTGGK